MDNMMLWALRMKLNSITWTAVGFINSTDQTVPSLYMLVYLDF